MNITKELVDSLKSDDITKKRYNKIVKVIGDKVDGIWRHICKVSGREIDWWAFSNDVSYGHGNGSSGGEFDPEVDMPTVHIKGNTRQHPSDLYAYNEGFPTEFLWTDYKATVAAHLKEVEEEESAKKIKKINLRAKREEAIASIKKKLTPQELKLVTFVK